MSGVSLAKPFNKQPNPKRQAAKLGVFRLHPQELTDALAATDDAAQELRDRLLISLWLRLPSHEER
jgi:hypothetical protein